MVLKFVIALAAAILCGCTNTALQRSTIAVGSSVTELQYQIVLGNLAMFRARHPAAESAPDILPWHVKITQGSIGVTDTLQGTVTLVAPNISRTTQLSGTRAWAESWTIVPEIDHEVLRKLQTLYFCVATDPTFLSYFAEGERRSPDEPSGSYGNWIVSVRANSRQVLTNLTLAVLVEGVIKKSEMPMAVGVTYDDVTEVAPRRDPPAEGPKPLELAAVPYTCPRGFNLQNIAITYRKESWKGAP